MTCINYLMDFFTGRARDGKLIADKGGTESGSSGSSELSGPKLKFILDVWFRNGVPGKIYTMEVDEKSEAKDFYDFYNWLQSGIGSAYSMRFDNGMDLLLRREIRLVSLRYKSLVK